VKQSDASPVKILAFEFSSPQRSVAVVDEAQNEKRRASAEVLEIGDSGTRGIGMIDVALQQARVEREQIELIAVGLGPGSYNGIRLSIAMAQGWQLASGEPGIKVLGISSAECIVAEASSEGMEGQVTIIIHAQRGEFYASKYELASRNWRELEPLLLLSMEDVRKRETAGEHLIGPEVPKWFGRGSLVFPRAATLGRLALSKSNFISAEKMEPIYLRVPQFVKAPPARNL